MGVTYRYSRSEASTMYREERIKTFHSINSTIIKLLICADSVSQTLIILEQRKPMNTQIDTMSSAEDTITVECYLM